MTLNVLKNRVKMRFTAFFTFGLFALCLAWITSCQKEATLTNNLQDASVPVGLSSGNSNTFYVDGKNHLADNESNMTILGNKRANPFTVDNMNTANGTQGVLQTTHLYVKFFPKDGEDLKQLDETGVNFYDYPLDYEVVKMGEFYHDPNIPADKPTYLYAVVKPDFTFPSVPYEVLANLHLSKDEKLIENAMTRLGYNPEIEGYGINDDVLPVTEPTIPPPGGGGGGGNGGGEPTGCQIRTGACGCPSVSNTRNPAGCISVIDDANLPTNDNFAGQSVHVDGVRRVKVITKDTWFTESEGFTSDNGCFKINARYKGKAWVWVKFKSSRTTIRSFRLPNIWEYSMAVKDPVGTVFGPNFSNIRVVYSHVEDDDSRGKLYWYAATVNNAVHEYDEFASCDGNPTAPQDLEILLTKYANGEAAPMLNKLSHNPVIALGSILTAGTACSILGGAASLASPVAGMATSGVCNALTTYAIAFAPDVIYNYGEETTTSLVARQQKRSDKVKESTYHELGHAAHYQAIPTDRDLAWLSNVFYIVEHGGYGDDDDQNDTGADKCATIEAWGYHIGLLYADRRYGINHSNVMPDARINSKNANRHIFDSEQHDPNRDRDLDNPIPRWIPRGLANDLIDNNANNPAGVFEPVNDPITGFSTRVYFQEMVRGTGIPSPILLRNRLIGNNPSNASATDIGNLFQEYRWQ